MKPSKAVIAGAAVAGLLTGSMAVRAYALNTSSRPSVSLWDDGSGSEAATPTRVQRSKRLQGAGRWQASWS